VKDRWSLNELYSIPFYSMNSNDPKTAFYLKHCKILFHVIVDTKCSTALDLQLNQNKMKRTWNVDGRQDK
jgi:hypothetical protein